MAYFCSECGTKMAKADDEVLVCPQCQHSVDIADYEHEEESFSSAQSYLDEPECCRACGGPYPNCKTSCKIFDD